MAAGQSSIALAVQQLTQKIERLIKLNDDIIKLANGDVAHDMNTTGASANGQGGADDGQASSGESQAPVYTEAGARAKLKDFLIDYSALESDFASQILAACIHRAEDKQCYEKSKLAKGEADKLGNMARSMNPEIAEPARIKRVEVQDYIAQLGQRQLEAQKKWKEFVAEKRLTHKSKTMETDADFDALATAVELWYQVSLHTYLERVQQRAEAAHVAIASIRANDSALNKIDAALPRGFSTVAVARNQLNIGRRVELSKAEKYVAELIAKMNEDIVRANALAQAGISQSSSTSASSSSSFSSSSSSDFASASSSSSSSKSSPSAVDGEADKDTTTMNSYMTSRRVPIADIDRRRALLVEKAKKDEHFAARAFVVGRNVQCMGRVGTVIFVGPTSLGPGQWVGIRLVRNVPSATSPLIYSMTNSFPLRCGADVYKIMASKGCPVDTALFAPVHAVSGYVEKPKTAKESRPSAHTLAAAVKVQTAIMRFTKRRANESRILQEPHCCGPFSVVDALAVAAPEHVTHSIQTLARYLCTAPATVIASSPFESKSNLTCFSSFSAASGIGAGSAINGDTNISSSSSHTGANNSPTIAGNGKAGENQVPATSAYAKARAIFKWICTHIRYHCPISESVCTQFDGATVLASRIADAEGMSTLFLEMCEAVGLDCIIIRGIAKGVGACALRNPIDGTNDSPNHCWNAVKVDGGRWILVDTAWSSGYFYAVSYVQEFSPAYFDPSPARMVYSHFPISVSGGQRHFADLSSFVKEPFRAQLLPRPVYKYEFVNGLHITRDYIESGLDVIHPTESSSLTVEQPFCALSFLCPNKTQLSVILNPPAGSESSIRTNRHLWHVSYEPFPPSPHTHRVASILIAFPVKGQWSVTVCVQPAPPPAPASGSYPALASQLYSSASMSSSSSSPALASASAAALISSQSRPRPAVVYEISVTKGMYALRSKSDISPGFLKNVTGYIEGDAFTLVEPTKGFFELDTRASFQLLCPASISRVIVVNGSRWSECVPVSTPDVPPSSIAAHTSLAALASQSNMGIGLGAGASGAGVGVGAGVAAMLGGHKESTNEGKRADGKRLFEGAMLIRDTTTLRIVGLDTTSKTFVTLYRFNPPPASATPSLAPTGISSGLPTSQANKAGSFSTSSASTSSASSSSLGNPKQPTLISTASSASNALTTQNTDMSNHEKITFDPSGRAFLMGVKILSCTTVSRCTVLTLETSANVFLHSKLFVGWPKKRRGKKEAEMPTTKARGEVRVMKLKIDLAMIARTLSPSQTTVAACAALLAPPTSTPTATTAASISMPSMSTSTSSSAALALASAVSDGSQSAAGVVQATAGSNTSCWQISAELPSPGEFLLQIYASNSKNGLYRVVAVVQLKALPDPTIDGQTDAT